MLIKKIYKKNLNRKILTKFNSLIKNSEEKKNLVKFLKEVFYKDKENRTRKRKLERNRKKILRLP